LRCPEQTCRIPLYLPATHLTAQCVPTFRPSGEFPHVPSALVPSFRSSQGSEIDRSKAPVYACSPSTGGARVANDTNCVDNIPQRQLAFRERHEQRRDAVVLG